MKPCAWEGGNNIAVIAQLGAILFCCLLEQNVIFYIHEPREAFCQVPDSRGRAIRSKRGRHQELDGGRAIISDA